MLTIPDPEKTGGLRLDERTIAEALGDVGYATWIVGKWHLGHWLTEYLPLQRGFDHHYGLYTGQIRSFTHTRGASRLDWHRNGRPVVESGYSTFLLADEAVQLIGRHDGANPFFLYLPFNAMHTPHDAPQEYLDLYSGQTKYKQRAMLKAMDDAIGSVLAALESKGILDDTLVMFLSDNGDAPEARTTGPEPVPGSKGHLLRGRHPGCPPSLAGPAKSPRGPRAKRYCTRWTCSRRSPDWPGRPPPTACRSMGSMPGPPSPMAHRAREPSLCTRRSCCARATGS